MTVPSFMTKTTEVAGTVDTDRKAPAHGEARPTESRQTRTAIVVSVTWFAVNVWFAITMASGHRFDLSTFLTVLIIGGAMPLLVVWGVVWIMAAPKKGQTEPEEAGTEATENGATRRWNVPQVASLIGWVERHRSEAVFGVGVLAVIVAQFIALASRSNLVPDHPGYATGLSVGMSLIKILIYALLLGLVAVAVRLRKPEVNRLKVMAWLLLAIGLIDCGVAVVSMCVMPRDSKPVAGGAGRGYGSTSPGGYNAAASAALPESAARQLEAAWGLVGKTGREIVAKAAQYTPPSVEGIGTAGNNELFALVNGDIVYEGSKVNGFTVRKISEDKIEFEKDGTVFTRMVY